MNNKLYGNLIFELSRPGRRAYSLPKNRFAHHELPAELRREQDAELPECDEMTVVRHYTNHSENNFGVLNGFYPLGSCTMKYNPIINEEMAALPGFNNLHPLQPVETAQGALEVVYNLQHSLATLAGLHDFTLNPCAGAHGELTGLMIIRSYHQSRGDVKRTKVIVPDSAHGTNPASAAVCGLDIVEVKSTAEGLVDVEDLKPLLGDDIAAIMMTNPNTLGLFEKEIPEIAKLVHACGALLYYDGANFNPILGVARPGDMGFDCIHSNLHKTFATPHGGGGPGAGAVGCKDFLRKYMPGPLVVEKDGKVTSYLVNTFDKDFYNLDGLTQMVEEEAEEFNATHTEATENPMNVKTVQVLGDGVMVQVVQEFADTDSYAEYNEQDLFYGTRVEALAQGLTVNRELVNAADGTPADSEKLDKALEKNHLIITNASAYIYCPYPVLYISEGVVMGEDGYVDASQSDGVVTILMKK